jgi:hypothetical protein
MRALAKILAGDDPFMLHRDDALLNRNVSTSVRLRLNKLPGMWSYFRRLASEGRSSRNAVLSVRSRIPGEVSTCEWDMSMRDLVQLRERANSNTITMPWLFAAAWVRAIDAWNAARGPKSRRIVSLEVPVNLRVGKDSKRYVGNLVSPLHVFGDPVRPFEQLAKDLQRQFRDGLRQCHHMAVPLFTWPSRYLPWFLFHRLAVNSTSTGFATSHFTWLEHRNDLYRDVSTLSGGVLRVLAHHVYGPVCLHMGAALMVVALPGSTKVCLTYRKTALDENEARTLSEMLRTELAGTTASIGSFAQ